MANKALSKRQKMTIRVEPSQRPLKARNPSALSARKRVAGAQSEPSGQRNAQQGLLKKLLGRNDDE